MIGCLDKAIRPWVLIMPKMSGCVKRFKVKDGDKGKNNKLMSFPCIWWEAIRKISSYLD